MNFLCLDCHLVGPLTKHGRCGRCDSGAVMHSERYGNQQDQQEASGSGVRRQVALLDYRAKEKLYQARLRKAAKKDSGEEGDSTSLVGRGK